LFQSNFDTNFNGPADEPDESLRDLSHEIRSKTQGLLGYLDIFTEEVEAQLTPDQKHLLDRINYFAKSLSDLITDLLAAVREENCLNNET